MKSILVILFCLFYAESYKILVVYPLYIRSINILGQGIVRHLLNNGHEVTFITTFPMDKPQSKNFRQIDISNNSAVFADDTFTIGYILENGIVQYNIFEMQKVCSITARLTFENTDVIQLLENKNEHFDAVLVDLFESEVYAGLAALYNCPMLWAYSLGAHWQVLRLLADPGNPAYDADYNGINIPPFTFAQRIEELWTRVKWHYYKTFFTMPEEQQIYEETFGPLLAKRGRELPDYEKVIFNASMIFGNGLKLALWSSASFRPSTPQNFKYIGGFHVHDPVKPLAKELQDLMDNAPHGVIYFSLGSFWQSKQIPIKITRDLLNVFGELKQTVIWKYEDDLEDLPKNVHTVRWAPQQSILAHPNCKIFISHGGLLSSIESVHFGVPVIGTPIFMDQFININKAVAQNYALKVDLNYDMPQNLKTAINRMLSDDSFRKNVKKLSSIYHDTPMKPGEELAHWVRHVVRTRGAPHLRSPALNVPLYQRLYLDLLGLLIGILFVVYVFLKNILQKIKTETKMVKEKKKN